MELIFATLFFCGNISESVCNKLIKALFIDTNHLFFHEGIIFEDDLWTFRAAISARSLFIVDSITYFYTVHEGSVMTSSCRKKRIDSYRIVLREMYHSADDYHLLNSFVCHDRIERFKIRLFRELVDDWPSFHNEYVSLHDFVHYSWYDCILMNKWRIIKLFRDFHFAFPTSIGAICYFLYIKTKVLIG